MIRKKVEACIAILEDLYGVPQAEEIDPVDLLVMTILSQNTSDANSLRAFGSLKSAYSNYEETLAATDEEIAEKIRVGGMARIKASRIRSVLSKIRQDAGAIDLASWPGWTKKRPRSICCQFPASVQRLLP